MDSIRLFLENMFYGIAPSARVTRAKEQLLEMMEDKYYELKEQGLSENETVGRVISEFGNLEEIAEDLGIRNEVFDKEEGEPQERLIVTRERALHYLASMKRVARNVGIGVVICILSGIPFILSQVSGPVAEELGMLPIALGVYLFINAAMRRSSMEALLNRNDYTVEKRRSNQLIERIGGPYWLLATIVYLGWSFLTNDWHITWVVWPIAGICFGLIAAIIGAVYGEKNISKGSN